MLTPHGQPARKACRYHIDNETDTQQNCTTMADTTKVSASDASVGTMGQTYLATGESVAMRMWEEQPGDAQDKQLRSRSYETVGYVISGKAELELDGETVVLNAGDSWVVPKGVAHSYTILESFVAVEATSPPARKQ